MSILAPRLRQLVANVTTILVVLPFALPLVWMVWAAFWPDNQPLSNLFTPIDQQWPSMENFALAADMVPLGRFSLNSLAVVLIAVPSTLVVASLAGFAITRLPSAEQNLLLQISLLALLAPPTALWLARFPIFKALGWIDTLWPLMAPALLGGSPFFVLLFYWSVRRLPDAQFDAALIDGASLWQIWARVVLPQSRLLLFGVGILSFALFWGNFTDPLLYIRSESQMTLPVGVRLLAQLDRTRWPVMMAGAVVLTLPVLVAFGLGQLMLQRQWSAQQLTHLLRPGAAIERRPESD